MQITKENFTSLISQGVCVVEMSAPWCGDCRRIQPIMDSLKEQYKNIKFITLDFDSNGELKEALNIRKIPTLIFYKNGIEVGERLIEPDNKLPIENAIKSLL